MDPTAANQHFTNEKGKGWNIKIYNFWFNQDIIVNNIYQQNSNTVVQDFIQININIKDKQKVRMDRSIRMIKPICQKQNQSKLVNKRTDILTSLHNIKLPLHEYQYQSLKNNQLQLPSLHTEMCSPYHISSYRQYKPSAYKLYRDKDMTISEDYCSKYGDQVQYTLRKEFVKGRFLSGHKIDATLRARMLDWMIQVMSSYNFQNKTYFAGVQIMDRYFSECSQTLVPTQLHIIGVESMQMATKMQQVYPLKLKTTYQKIVHKKISISELMEMQSKILHALSFNLVSSSIYDLAMTKIVRQLTLNSTYSEVNVKQIEDVCGCIAKFIYFNYELVCQYSKQVLASALVGQVSRVCKIGLGEKLGLEELECRDKIAECINGFRQKYKGLNNISKYTSRKIMEIVDPSII